MSDHEEDTPCNETEADPRPTPLQPNFIPLPSVAVAVVGVSSKGLTALKSMFAAAGGSELAWVVALRQTDAIDVAQLAETLGRVSGLRAQVTSNGTEPQADCIYVAPPDQLMTFAEARLHLRPVAQAIGERGVIDSLFVSLAEVNGQVAVGVLLSGLGLDGTAGVMALKEQGGLLVCERDERGAGGEMQLLADPAGLADFVLAAEEIVPRVGQYMRHLRESSARRDEQAAEQGIADQISRIAAVLRQRTGHDFHGIQARHLPAPDRASHAGQRH